MSNGPQLLRQSVLASIKAQLVTDLFAVPAIEDYIVCRWSYINGLDRQFLWSSLQCIEKMLKALLISNEIDTRRYGHHIGKMALALRSHGGLASLEAEFHSFQQRDKFGARTPLEFISNLEKLGAPSTRYRLTKTVVYFDDIHRMDETYFRLTSFSEPMGLFGSGLPPPSFREHTTYSDAVQETLTQGNLSFKVPSQKPLHKEARMKESPVNYPEDPLSVRSEAMKWLRSLAKV